MIIRKLKKLHKFFRTILSIDEPSRVLIRMPVSKERYLIRNVLSQYETLLDAIHEINGNFSIQVKEHKFDKFN
jgi:hypothetical protein